MTPALTRAARGLLNWRQQDLAKEAKVSLSAVVKFERGEGRTRATTIAAMTNALKEKGIEFPPGGGVRHMEEVVGITRIAGKDFVQKLNDDIASCLKKPGDEILSFSVDEGEWFNAGLKETADRYYKWRNGLGVKQYYIVGETNKVFESPRSHYRILPPEMIGKVVFLIYGDRIAFCNIRKKLIFIMRGKEIAAPFREQFKYFWRIGRKA